MNRYIKILLAAILVAAFFTQDRVCEYLGFGQSSYHKVTVEAKESEVPIAEDNPQQEDDFFIDDFLYRWDDQLLQWVVTKDTDNFQTLLTTYPAEENSFPQPIEIEWELLLDIRYRLRYFEELGMEIYAPVFRKAQKVLEGKEVLIEGFVIPFDEEEELIALSANPYASCFFCGNASPASIITMYMRNKGKRYKIDDFKKFRGTLHLNSDDPNEFYYILRDARQE